MLDPGPNGRETCLTWLGDGGHRTHALECVIEALEIGCAVLLQTYF